MKKRIGLSIGLILTLCCSWVTAQTTTINGLAVIVDYSDVAVNTTIDSIDNMMNQTGFSGWGNNGSIKEYYLTQSDGKVVINSEVIRVQVPESFAYYHIDDEIEGYNGGIELVKDVVAEINTNYPLGFTGLTLHPTQNRLQHFCIITSGSHGLGVAYGFNEGLSVQSDGISIPVKHVSLNGYQLPNKPEINVVCHEMGHNVFDWSDYYDVNNANIGHYGLMGSGGSSSSPMHINPVFRVQKGWVDNVIDLDASTAQTITATSNDYSTVYRYKNPNNPNEYYLIEPYIHSKYYLSLTGDGYTPDEGLAIWYVDETNIGSSLRLVQADGLDEMNDPSKTHLDHRGDASDLFDDTYSTFSDATHGLFRWKNGDPIRITLGNISAPGVTMTFDVIPNTCTQPDWITSQAYTTGQKVSYNGNEYEAKWWTQNDQPDQSNVWLLLGPCGGISTNQVPSISITTPTTSQTFAGLSAINFTVNTADADGSVQSVTYTINGTTQTVTGSNPFAYSWTPLAAGTYTLSAYATDDDSDNSSTESVTFTVEEEQSNILPTISITSPSSETTFTDLNPITITVNAVDSDGSIQKVTYTVNGISTDITSPSFNYTFTPSNGIYTVSVVAIDNESASSNSASITFTVDDGSEPSCSAPSWETSVAYAGNDIVSHNGHEWKAKWWTLGEEPGTTGEWGVWNDLGACGSSLRKAVLSLENTDIFPNPTSGKVQIESISEATLSILASDGTTQKIEKLNAGKTTLDISDYNAGIYLFQVKSHDQIKSFKVMKQ